MRIYVYSRVCVLECTQPLLALHSAIYLRSVCSDKYTYIRIRIFNGSTYPYIPHGHANMYAYAHECNYFVIIIKTKMYALPIPGRSHAASPGVFVWSHGRRNPAPRQWRKYPCYDQGVDFCARATVFLMCANVDIRSISHVSVFVN